MVMLALQNRILKYSVVGLLLMLVLLGAVTALYVADTRTLRRDMLEYAHESIKLEYEKLRNDKEQSLKKGFKDLEQIEKLLDDYRNNSMEMDDLLYGMEEEIMNIREHS